MIRICLFIAFIIFPLFSQAQYFKASAGYDGNDIVFFIQPNSGGGDITTSWSDIEFFLRYPDGSPSFNYGAITINTTDFPGIAMPNNGDDQQGTEAGYTNTWLGTSYLPSATMTTYTDGVAYEVFRITIDVNPATVGFELVHQGGFVPTYIALTDQVGGDLTAPTGNKFYGLPVPTNCTCPTSNTDVLILSSILPVELLTFSARAVSKKQTQLDWKTATEINNEGFEIQRMDQNTRWEKIGFVNGFGDSNLTRTYGFLDENPLVGINYYRLKQIDFDGQSDFTKIVSVSFSENESPYTIYPNPTKNELHLNQSLVGTLVVRNLLGQAVELKEFRGEVPTIDVSTLAVGQYFLEIIPVEGNKEGAVFIIQRGK